MYCITTLVVEDICFPGCSRVILRLQLRDLS
uniref:Uncharacterized protein n=1 Tax=Setaria italica TaxID=4555 RepID=K4AN77_SETIT